MGSLSLTHHPTLEPQTLETGFLPTMEELYGCPFLSVTVQLCFLPKDVEVLTPGVGSLQMIKLR